MKKQKKEIEELNFENIELKQEKIIDKNKIKKQDNFYDYYNYISKAKIKDTIIELEEIKKVQSENPFTNPIYIKELEYGIQVLQELLEEDKIG